MRKKQCLLKTFEAPYAGRGLIINEQRKHQAELKTMGLSPVCNSRHYSRSLKDFFICISIFVFFKGILSRHPSRTEESISPDKGFSPGFQFFTVCALEITALNQSSFHIRKRPNYNPNLRLQTSAVTSSNLD